MTASSVTARILSLAILILSLAPLGSLYVLFFSIGLGTGSPYSSANGSYEDSLASVLKNPNATLEDLWTAIFDSQMMYPQNFQAKAVLALLQNREDVVWLPVSAQSMRHLQILMPWILSFLLGVVLPCVVSIFTVLRRQRRRRSTNPAREKKILQLLTKSLEPYTKVLNIEDRVEADAADPSTLQWRLPLPGVSDVSHSSKGSTQPATPSTRIVNGLCGICLESFVETQAVSWSSNPSCTHCFHDTCILAWLRRSHQTRQRDNANPCPCCRRPFLKTGS